MSGLKAFVVVQAAKGRKFEYFEPYSSKQKKYGCIILSFICTCTSTGHMHSIDHICFPVNSSLFPPFVGATMPRHGLRVACTKAGALCRGHQDAGQRQGDLAGASQPRSAEFQSPHADYGHLMRGSVCTSLNMMCMRSGVRVSQCSVCLGTFSWSRRFGSRNIFTL